MEIWQMIQFVAETLNLELENIDDIDIDEIAEIIDILLEEN